MNNDFVRVLTIQYDGEITPFEVPYFRGAVIGAMRENANTLYHNHLDEERFRYSYPLIQYKRIGGKAAIVCVGDGTDIIGQFMAESCTEFQLGERHTKMEINFIKPSRTLVQVWSSDFEYTLNRWIPLNPENYKKYQATESIVEKISMLEQILKGNILSFAKGLNIMVRDEIKVSIKQLSDPFSLKIKGTTLLGFNLKFKSNLSLPDFIGLGKSASLGYGTVCRIKKDKKEKIHNT